MEYYLFAVFNKGKTVKSIISERMRLLFQTDENDLYACTTIFSQSVDYEMATAEDIFS